LFDSNKITKYIKSDISDSDIIKEWDDLRKVMWSNNGTVSPNRFVNNVQKVASIKKKELFTGWSQNDMPEFLLFMIDCFHNSLSRKINIKISGKVENTVDNLAVKCYTMLKDVYSKEYSEIMDLFYGIYVSVLVSMDGSINHTINPESFFVLDLPIPIKSDITLYDCFDLFTKSEILSGNNAWLNEKTNEKEDVKKQILFWNFPKILVITLKRFSYDGMSKIDNLIDFPLEDLDLSKYVTGYNSSSYVYDLYGVCNHIGNVYMGHYTAFVKNSMDEWVHFNDSSVEIVKNRKMIITPMAYCLFYRKKNK
jgi:ubiquitin C-terminal hydrolase